jgi:hypothetical protein
MRLLVSSKYRSFTRVTDQSSIRGNRHFGEIPWLEFFDRCSPLADFACEGAGIFRISAGNHEAPACVDAANQF